MFVAELSASKLKALVQRLDIAEPRKVAALIAGIEKESTVLSQAVQKLSGHIDAIREQEDVDGGPMSAPVEDKSLLMVARNLKVAQSGFVCLHCGGVRVGGESGHIEDGAVIDGHASDLADEFLRAKNRARQRANEARR